MQKLVRAAFGNNNVDTCARVCHSPTGYGLRNTFGTSAGTQDFDSVEDSDVIVVIGANPTDGHPVFASRMKKRLRQGAKLIVIDPRRIDLVRTPHVEAAYHLPLLPGTNVAILTALAHVVVTEGLVNEAFVRERCDWNEFQDWADFVAEARNSPAAVAKISGVESKTTCCGGVVGTALTAPPRSAAPTKVPRSSATGRDRLSRWCRRSAGKTVNVRIRALKPGTYAFFDDFNQQTTGRIVAE